MKKAFFLVAVATITLLSCQKENENTNEQPSKSGFTFKASIEALSDSDTKATLDADSKLVWATGDKIGIYVNDNTWTDKNQPFTLSSGEGTNEGEFAWDYSGTFSDKAAAAFFPWDNNDNAADGTLNNVYEGNAYFTLNEGIYSYSSGKMLTPLVAPLSGSTDDIQFKHAGAAVKVHINNVPKRVHSIGMTVNGQQVTGEFMVNAANAGTDAMVPVTADATKNTVWLNIWNGSQAAWDFIFPVPELTKPKLSFQMYDENDILVWSTNLKAQASDLKRGEVLAMPAIDITPYKQFKESTEWTLCGKLVGKDAWGADIPLYTDGTVSILKGMTFKAGDEFKIRKNKAWDEAYPGSNFTITEDCTKDVWFNNSTHEITLKDTKCDYPAPKVTLYFGINGAIPKSIHISSSTLAPGSDWPGLELTEKEYINGKWYYKHVVDGTTVWGNTISSVYIVSKDSWNTSGSTLTFSDIKTEYYFEATASTAIEQLSARPADSGSSSATITIGGGFTDWASVEGVTNGNNTVKVASDATNLYVYFSRTSASGEYAAMWNGGGYVYVAFDLDNDSSTGSGTIYGNTAECITLLYPFSTAYTFYTTPQSNWQCQPSPYTIENVTLYGEGDATAATAEICFPRANLPTIPTTDPITIKLWGNKGMSTVSITRML